ncbi:MAG TPA: UvrD-helicase domain-containing protein [Methylococcaceae bacterium]|nr:UvrD-helicase domain-containing protein [Methylococcaceae bacterium]
MADSSPLPDAAARRRAVDPHSSFIVQAPAGSGKTELLTQRLLALLVGVEEPEEVVAITFTRKAAGEMRRRVLDALILGAGTSPEEGHRRATWELARRALAREAERGWRLMEAPGRLRILTVDALCAELTRRMPLSAGFGAPPEVAEDAAELYREAARATLRSLEDGDAWSDAIAGLLTHLDNDTTRLESLLAAMLPKRDQWLRHLGRARGADDQRRLEQELRAFLDGELRRLEARIPTSCRPEWLELGRYAAANLQKTGKGESPLLALTEVTEFPPPSAAALPAWRALAELVLTKEGTWRKSLTVNQGFPSADKEGKAQKARAQEFIASLADCRDLAPTLDAVRRLPSPQYDDAQWRLLEALVESLRIAAAHLQVIFRDRGAVDFPEVAARALQALGEEEAPTDLALALDSRIHHVLVDEFQDTSRLQVELLRRLTAGWQHSDGRTLFLVGDPMQSIYRFREADVGLFLLASRQGIGAVRLEPLTLSANFRSQQGVIDWVNAAFGAVFPAPGEENAGEGAVSYAPSSARHPLLPEPAVHVHPWLERDDLGEAGRILEIIAAARREHPAGTTAVLARSRAHLNALLPLLREQGVAFRAMEIEPLGGRGVVQDLLALARALCFPADRTAWLALLRAPWCGLRLDDLAALAEGQDATVECLLETRLEQLSADGRIRAARIRDIMRAAHAALGRMGLRDAVRGVWAALGGPALLVRPGDAEAAQGFFDLLDRFDEAGSLNRPDALEEALAELRAPSDPAAGESLQIMTLHKAKGLEFDTVILPGLGRRPRPKDKPLLAWLETLDAAGEECLLLAPLADGETKNDPLYAFVRELEKRKDAHETGRLLYVAATRAKRRLHLLGHVPPSGGPEAGSLLDKLWPVVEREFAESSSASGGEAIELTESPVLTSLPPRGRTGGGELTTVAETCSDHPHPNLPPEGEGTGKAGIELNSTVSIAGGWDRIIPTEPSPPLLRRVAADWRPEFVALRDYRRPGAPDPVVREDTVPVEFDWAGETARHVGVATHEWLCRMARAPLEDWTAERFAGLEDAVAARLERLGVPGAEIAPAARRVLDALRATLDDPRGRWILSSGHADSRTEWALTGVLRGETVSVAIDRSFVDAAGTRWIVDYKTGVHEGGGREEFLDREQARYRPQLERYAALVSLCEDRPIRLGLYFPLAGGWREWAATMQS